ncbi:unnamed protein product [Auanema sp. JU1783]|nr:unnamed protein product [Auanema sp. JU1783]
MPYNCSLMFSLVLILLMASVYEARVVKQVQLSRDMPTWRSSVRVRQIQGNFPRLSSFHEGGARPQLFGKWAKRQPEEEELFEEPVLYPY